MTTSELMGLVSMYGLLRTKFVMSGNERDLKLGNECFEKILDEIMALKAQIKNK